MERSRNFVYFDVLKLLLNLQESLYTSTNLFKNTSIYNQFHNILRLFDVLPNFLSLQVKRCAIITYKHGIYDLPHYLPNDLRLRILGN